MTNDTSKFPVDVALLEKGSAIPPEVIEAAYQTSRSLANYSLKVLTCIDEIYRQLGPRGAGWVIRQREHGIRVLTDLEASQLLANEQDNALRSHLRNHVLLGAVDTQGFDDEQAAQHERRQLRSGAFSQAIVATRKKMRQIAAQTQQAQISAGGSDAAAEQAKTSTAKNSAKAANVARGANQ
jgi:hypothetical protein